MKKSRRQTGKASGRDLDLSLRFESKNRKRLRRRNGEKAGRKAARRGK